VTTCARALATALLLSAALAGRAACQAGTHVPDDVLRAHVEGAIRAASDLPGDSIAVEVAGGVVTLSGSLLCGDCGGNATPGGTGTVQQSLGAIVRAVPGVASVRFRLTNRPPA
jgi:osmotically-inducible protein OsmY